MALFFKVLTCALAGVVLLRLLDRQGSAAGIPFALLVCVLILMASVSYLQPVLELLRSLQKEANLNGELLTIILKAVGIGLIGEVAALICSDGGNAALARGVEIATAAVLMWLSLPMIKQLLELIQQITGNL